MLPRNLRTSISALVISLTLSVVSGVSSFTEARAQDTLRIGVSAPLTGELAEYGAAVRQGIELAVSEQKNSFKNLRFIYEDNQYEGAKAVSALQKLVKVDAVSLIYTWGEAPLHSVAPIAERQRVPIIAMSLDPAPALGRRYVIRSINYSEQYAIKLLEYLRTRGFRKIAIVNTEDPFFYSMIDGLKRHTTQEESIDVVASVTPEEQDFRSHLTRLKTKNFDAVGVYLLSGQVAQFYRQAKSFNFTTPTFGTDVFESRAKISEAQGGMDGAVYPNIEVPTYFVDSYVKRYGTDTQIAYAYNAYSFAQTTAILFRGITTKVSPDQIINAFSNPPTNLGFTFTESTEGGKFYEFPIVIKRIQGNEISRTP